MFFVTFAIVYIPLIPHHLIPVLVFSSFFSIIIQCLKYANDFIHCSLLNYVDLTYPGPRFKLHNLPLLVNCSSRSNGLKRFFFKKRLWIIGPSGWFGWHCFLLVCIPSCCFFPSLSSEMKYFIFYLFPTSVRLAVHFPIC